jgi:hypothetical protein
MLTTVNRLIDLGAAVLEPLIVKKELEKTRSHHAGEVQRLLYEIEMLNVVLILVQEKKREK